jgi:hypothetical protein
MMKSSRTPSQYPAKASLVAWLVALACWTGCGTDDGEQMFALPGEADVEVGATPGATWEPLIRTVDMGAIWQGAVRDVRFPIVSAGTEPAKIQSIKSSCGCTLVAAYVVDGATESELEFGRTYPPGTRVEVAARYDSRGRHGREAKFITVYGDSPDGRVRLEIGVETKPFLEAEPEGIAFDRVYPTPGLQASTLVTAIDGEPFELALASEVAPGLSVVSAREGAGWRITATLDPKVPPGPMIQELVFVSDREMPQPGDLESVGVPPAVRDAAGRARHYLVLPISAVVVGPLETLPPYLPFGFVGPGSLTSQSTRIECFDSDWTAAFLNAKPVVRFTGTDGAPLPAEFEDAFQASWRLVRPDQPGVRALSKGATAALDLEVALTGRRGAGQNRLVGEVHVSFAAPAGSETPLPAQKIDFQVILQP